MEMNDLKDIIDLQCHPVGDATYATRCRSKFQKFSILVLKNFLRKDALVNLQIEASELQGKAFYCSQNHNVLLTEKMHRWVKTTPAIWKSPAIKVAFRMI